MFAIRAAVRTSPLLSPTITKNYFNRNKVSLKIGSVTRCLTPKGSFALQKRCFSEKEPLHGRHVADEHVIAELKERVSSKYCIHPLSHAVHKYNVEQVLRSYLAMSEAFPYIQAGAYKDLILSCIHQNRGASPSMEETFVVGAFLSFDETGGNYLLRTEGIAALPRILETHKLFHAALLRHDISKLLHRELTPDYGQPTRDYLLTLLKNLGGADPIERKAAMVAFELHAGEMIEALWGSLQRLYPEQEKDSLEYFRVHVGGDDPQEEYHKQLTQKMISKFTAKEKEQFLASFEKNYALNFNWCADICKI